MLNSLVNATWVDESRLRVYPLLIVGFLTAATIYVLIYNGGVLPNGAPFGTDFASFWVAAREGLLGDPLIPYSRATFEPVQEALFPGAGFFAFFYPPHFQLYLLPLGALPFFGALFVWQALTFALVAWVMTRITGNVRLTVMLAISFPAAFLTIAHGQNAFLSAGLFAAGLYFLPTRPILAGVMFGLLTFKPQLGILIPVALIAAWQWRTIVSAGITTFAVAGLSAAVLGVGVWEAFLAQTTAARELLNTGSVGWSKMISVYSALRAFSLPYALAMSAHILVAMPVLVAIIAVWRRGSEVPHPIKCAVLMVGALVVTPFGLNYDLYLLAPAAAFFIAGVSWDDMESVERNGLIAGFILPLSILFTMPMGYSLAPWIVLLLFAVFAHRALMLPKKRTETAAEPVVAK